MFLFSHVRISQAAFPRSMKNRYFDHAVTFRICLIFTLVAGLVSLPLQHARATACVDPAIVMNRNDHGPDSLRQAILDVCLGGTVNFDAGLAGQNHNTDGRRNLDKQRFNH